MPGVIEVVRSLPERRVVRFAASGGVSGLVQLAVLALLVRGGFGGLRGNLVAFVVAAQVNFTLCELVTWADRHDRARVPTRWARFMVAIAGTGALNLAVFSLFRSWTADVPAAAAGILVAAVMNFLIADNAIFTGRRAPGPNARMET